MEDHGRIDRRTVLRMFGGGLIAAAAPAIALRQQAAMAGISWCRLDPIVEIAGKRVHIYVWSYQDDMKTIITGPTEVTIAVPKGIPTKFIWADDGFGLGYTVEFTSSRTLAKTPDGVEARVNVLVPASTGQSVVVDVELADGTLLGSRQGSTNKDIVVAATA